MSINKSEYFCLLMKKREFWFIITYYPEEKFQKKIIKTPRYEYYCGMSIALLPNFSTIEVMIMASRFIF